MIEVYYYVIKLSACNSLVTVDPVIDCLLNL